MKRIMNSAKKFIIVFSLNCLFIFSAWAGSLPGTFSWIIH